MNFPFFQLCFRSVNSIKKLLTRCIALVTLFTFISIGLSFSTVDSLSVISVVDAKKQESKSNKNSKKRKESKINKVNKIIRINKENKSTAKSKNGKNSKSSKKSSQKENKNINYSKSKKSKNKNDVIKEALNKVSHQKNQSKRDDVQEYLETLSKKQRSSFKKLRSKEKMRLVANFSAKQKPSKTINNNNSNNNSNKPITIQTATSQPIHIKQDYNNTKGRSFGQLAGLHQTIDPLSLSAGSVVVLEEVTGQAIFSKNANAILPIASITKLMTALVTLDARLAMTDIIVIDNSDVDILKGSSSRLRVGTRLTRAEALLLAMMSSENRAAHALARTHPLGMQVFIQLMNQKARQIGMTNTYFSDPTGLSSNNRATASDLVKMVKAAYQQPVIRQFSTSTSYQLQTDYGLLSYGNTNPLVGSQNWSVNVSKTGYITEAGRCLVMHVQILGRNFIFVLLDAIGKSSRVNDAIRIRQWIEQVLTTQTVNP